MAKGTRKEEKGEEERPANYLGWVTELVPTRPVGAAFIVRCAE